ncbi:MAG: hypothetical protein KDM91_20690, partial [Verrucomicrobiae bacterium]|nr:hypothetical protein [Verrucomicrobiae bacterium]
YGNTNVAGSLLAMITPQTVGPDTGERDFIHLGFRDTGQVFQVRGTNSAVTSGNALDLNNRALEADNDVIVGINDVQYYRDVDGDTVPDGVYAINSTGVLDDSNLSTGGDPTLIPFANRYIDQSGTTNGNWWWQQLDPGQDAINAGFVSAAGVIDPLGLGGRLPEYGAGQSQSNRADINVALTGGLLMQSGGRNNNYVQIGHGGNATGWGDDRGNRDSNLANNISGQNSRNWTYNGARDWSGTSIARLAPVYGNISILTGVDAATVQYDRGADEINLTGDTTSTGGFLRMEAWQNPEDAAQNNTNNIASPNQSSDAYVQIGHLGTGQFGSVAGDINVKAGGDIEILAGAHTRNHATIGHTTNGLIGWNTPDTPYQQVRFFHNTGDMDNPNLRFGELFLHENGTDEARGWYEEDTQTNRWDDDFWDVDGDLNDGINTHGVAVMGAEHVAALNGSTGKTRIGDIRVESYGANGIVVRAYSTPDSRTRTTDDPLSVGDLDGDTVSARADGTDDPDDADGWTFSRERRFAGIGHGGTGQDVWSDLDNERVRLSVDGGDGTGTSSASVEFDNSDGGSRIGRVQTFVNLIGDIEVTAHNGGVEVSAGNDHFDFAYIGHGGNDLADYETSGVAIGDITVTGAGDLNLNGAGVLATYTGAVERDFHAYSVIGHHGREVGTQYFTGDISVNFDGNITLTGGRYRESGAKIGHQTPRSLGQVGGEFSRSEEFLFGQNIDGGSPVNLTVDVTDSSVTIDNGGIPGLEGTFAISGYTSDIEVNAGGDVLLTHADPGVRLTQNMYAFDQVTGNTDLDFNDIRWSQTQIGHGGRETGGFRTNGDNLAYYYKDKTGNIAVNAGTLDAMTGAVTGGNVTLQNGTGLDWWTVIGHSFGASGADRANGPDTVAGSWNLIG